MDKYGIVTPLWFLTHKNPQFIFTSALKLEYNLKSFVFEWLHYKLWISTKYVQHMLLKIIIIKRFLKTFLENINAYLVTKIIRNHQHNVKEAMRRTK